MRFKNMKRFSLLVFCYVLLTFGAKAQKLGVKSNLLYDATSTVNLGAEIGLSKKMTLDVSGNFNPWTYSNNKKLKHWMVQPELRYWICEKFNGSFFGVHLMGGEFDVANVHMPFGMIPSLKDHRYEGWFTGMGLVYGYQWILGKHWNLEGAVGAGYDYVHFDKYRCGKCGPKIESGHINYFGVTKFDLSLVYLF